VAEGLREYAARRRISTSAAAAELLDEALRMQRFPGIDFRWTPSGRCAHITGTGLAAWEVYMIWEDHKGNLKAILRHYPSLRGDQVQAAVSYLQAYPDEMPSLEPPAYAKRVSV
jgi:uncharacterized protein (DUF433 family)